MTLIKLTDGTPDGLPIGDNNFRALFPEANFGLILQPSAVEAYGYGLYDFTRPPQCGKYEKPKEITPVKDSRGIWMQTWDIVEMDSSEKAQMDSKQAQFVRDRRNSILYLCDWTQLPDADLSSDEKNQWVNYRKLLRDISTQKGFPWDVVWPTKPQ